MFSGLQYAYLDPSSKDATSTDIISSDTTGTSRSQDDSTPVTTNGNGGLSGGMGIINGIRSGLSASSKKAARSEITLDELSDLYRSEAEEELREQEVAEKRERLAVAAAANKRLFGNEGTPHAVTVNSTVIDQSSSKGQFSQPQTSQHTQQANCTVTDGPSVTLQVACCVC